MLHFNLIIVNNSSHSGSMASMALKGARKGFFVFAFTHADSLMKTYGGKNAFFGTNPICFATPTNSKIPFILDSSVSVINRGKIRRAAKLGLKIPFDVALDKNGKPTDDPKKAIEGVQLPIAGFRGSGLAWMVLHLR